MSLCGPTEHGGQDQYGLSALKYRLTEFRFGKIANAFDNGNCGKNGSRKFLLINKRQRLNCRRSLREPRRKCAPDEATGAND